MATTTGLQAICTKCNRLLLLEVCFECSQPLCRSCIVSHFEAWRHHKGSQGFEAESSIDACKKNIENIFPVINKNIDFVNQLRTQINKTYNDTLNKLNEEKKILLDTLNDVEKDKSLYFYLKKMITLKLNIFYFKSQVQGLQKEIGRFKSKRKLI